MDMMESLKPKIAIIGAGNVGSTFDFSLMISGLVREIEQFLKLDLSDQEQELFKHSADTLKQILKSIHL
jgi:malate/lactate dehydrogenase